MNVASLLLAVTFVELMAEKPSAAPEWWQGNALSIICLAAPLRRL